MSSTKKKKNYSDSQLINAIAAVKNGSSFNQAAIKFEVLLSTIRDRYYGKYNEGKHKPGPLSALSYEQEEQLKTHLLTMANIGYGVPKKDIALLVKEILDRAEGEDPDNYKLENRKFKDNLPSIGWTYRFLARYDELASRIPENLGHQRTAVSESKIKSWFKEFENFLRDEHQIDVHEFLNDNNGDRIFNLDESGFPLAGTNGKLKVITARGAKNVYKIAPDTKEQITVLGCVSASGTFSKPFVIFPGLRPKYNLKDVNPDDFNLGSSQNGWISADSFFGWLANLFFPSIQDKVRFPIIIFMDGHTSHINLAVSTFCKEHNIILYCFPAHASHIMQPLDVSVYGPLKKYWNSQLNEFAKEYRGLAMNRSHFFKVFDGAWKKSIANTQHAVSGFRKCGLVPFNPDAVAYDRLIKQDLSIPTRTKKKVSDEEKVGMTRVFQLFEDCLSEEIKILFVRRFDNSYDIKDDTDRGIMYEFYKKARAMLEKDKVFKNTQISSFASQTSIAADQILQNSPANTQQETSSTKIPSSPLQMSTHTSLDCGTSMSVADSSSVSNAQEQDDNNTCLPSTSGSSVPSASGSSVIAYDKFEFSPFKNHFQIAPSLVLTRKFAFMTKPKTPSAISGKEYIDVETRNQIEKQRKLTEKEQRKRKREERQKIVALNKVKKSVKRKLIEVSSDAEEDNNREEECSIAYDDSSGDEALNEEDSCFACLSNDDWCNADVWIGCSGRKCTKWAHKSCISDEVIQMSKEELEAYDLYCSPCCKFNPK